MLLGGGLEKAPQLAKADSETPHLLLSLMYTTFKRIRQVRYYQFLDNF
jgi:hypothetical protein